ncbi:unnamed protein product [Rodentolepis nana]|uniref:Cyclic nucleotide-binding domain-containing protein n=1 Tax=Rodentolepis nana TaxID=102285 RepID=A0A158QHD6_RODNA|nr:unnamed protein product [Rodentolepis nana]
MIPNCRHHHQLLESDPNCAKTQPSTPRRRRNRSFTPSSSPSLSMCQHNLHSQNSVTIDVPIEYLEDAPPVDDDGNSPFTISEDFHSHAPRDCLYSSYLRHRLRETRTSSLDDDTLQNFQHPKCVLGARRRNPFICKALSIDNPYFEETFGDSHFQSVHGRPSEKPYLQSIQSCTAEEEDDSDKVDPASDLPFSNPRSELVLNTPAMDLNSAPQAPGRIYKPRLHRSVTIGAGDSNVDEIDVANSPTLHSQVTPQFRTRGALQKIRWTSRIARMKSLQRSRTIDTRGNTVQWNRGSLVISPDITVRTSEDELSEFQHLPDSRENLSSRSPKDTVQHEHLLKHPSLSKRSRLDAGTQYYSQSSSIDADQVCPAEMGKKLKVSISFATSQTNDTGLEAQASVESQIPSNAAAMADGYVEELCDPSKQSTSSYLKEQFFAFFQPSDNKLAMKLFGSKSALNKEKRRQQQHGKWIIHPCSSFRFYWDLLMLTLLIANLIILPVAISFFNDDLRPQWVVFNTVSDAVFIADIVVKFRTGIITNDYADDIILDPKEIARQYVRSWFLLDFISSIPLDYIFRVLNKHESYNQIFSAGRTLRILRLAKLLSMIRLLRLSRLVRYVSQWEEFLNIASKFMGIFNLVLLMLLLGHWNACLQFLIPLLMDYPEDSWVQRCRLRDADWFEQYTWALFKAMSHMLSIGYGRFPPTSISEAWITIVSMMTGATCYALFVGHAAALIQSFDTSKRLYREKFKQVEEYMAYRKLPRALRQRIADYYEHRYQGKMFDEAQILQELSECLREQIINYNCRELVAAVPFFTYADQDFVSEMVANLKFEVFQPGDLIIKEGTIGTKMYFIQEGIVDIITKDGEIATTLSDGSYFGGMSFLQVIFMKKNCY